MRDVEDLARTAVDCGLRVHKGLGPGLLESVYEAVLASSLLRAGLAVERQKPIAIEFDGMVFREGFRADLVVEGQLLVEVKSVERWRRSMRSSCLPIFACRDGRSAC